MRHGHEIPGAWLASAIAASGLLLTALMSRTHLELDPASHSNRLIVAGCLLAIVLRVLLRDPRSRGARIACDAVEHCTLFTIVCLLGALASYPMAADSIGFNDVTLERIDRLLRFDWVAWYGVVAAHPMLQIAERLAYQSIFVTPAILLGYFAFTHKRAEARLFIASFWLAAIVTLALFPLMPAEGPLAYLWHGHIPYMPESALYQSELIPLLRHHDLRAVGLVSLHGLVCAPSFHTVSAVLYIIAAWPIRPLRWPLLALNVAMLLATPVEGTHYLADMLGGAIVALIASLIVRHGLRGVLAARHARGGFAPIGAGAAPGRVIVG